MRKIRFLSFVPASKRDENGVLLTEPRAPEVYIEISYLNTKDVVCRRARQDEIEYFPEEYAAFKNPPPSEPEQLSLPAAPPPKEAQVTRYPKAKR